MTFPTSRELLDIIERARPQGLPCTGTQRCQAWTHRPECVISIAEQINRQRIAERSET